MASQTVKESHKWTPQETRRIIRFRAENENRFLKSKSSAKQLWETLIKELGLEGHVTSQQVSKKWENLKKKFKDLKTPKTGFGTDAGEVTAATWQFYEDMHEVLGARPSIDPPVVVASFGPDADPITILLEIVEPSCPDTASDTANTSVASPVATPNPSPKRKRRKSIVEFLIDESAKEQKRHEESEAKMDRFLGLFEKLIDKI